MLPSILNNSRFRTVISVIFWLMVWEIISQIIGRQVLLASPWDTIKTLGSLLLDGAFWHTVFSSLIRIFLGFLSAVLIGTILAVFAAWNSWVKTVLHPLMVLIKSTPVASFIILVLLWFGSSWLASIISFLMVLPVIFTNVLNGIESTDRKLLEMAQVFKLSFRKRVISIYLHSVMPFFLSALSIAAGMAWKSGIAAEVIGLPNMSIGEKLYQAKLFLNSADLIAWTIAIISFSYLFEKLILLLVKTLQRRLEA